MEQPQLILIRGVSGAGKTTLAKLIDCDLMVAADDYFLNNKGEYCFDPKLLGNAHSWCQACVEEAFEEEQDWTATVVVHNTFTTEKELEPYLAIAKQYNAVVTTLIVENRHGSGSVHDVPEKTLKKQAERLTNSIKLI